MKKQIIFMYSGQGSQYYHMGKELYENSVRFKFWMDHCDKIVHPLIETSIIDVLYRGQGKRDPFDRILHTNPALLSIKYSLSRVIMEMGIQPDYLLGYSLGEITAAIVSGALSLEEGLQLAVGKAKLVEQKSQLAEMLAIVESPEIMSEFPELFQNCWITGKNFKNNFVVSGLPKDIQYLREGLKEKNKISQILPVKYGFHTELIDSIEEEYKELVRKLNPAAIGIPIISSLKNERIQEVNVDYFWEVIRHPVDFEKTIDWVLKLGDFVFIDVGPSGSLATFVKYILPANSESLSLQMLNQFGKDLNSLEKLRTSLPVTTMGTVSP